MITRPKSRLDPIERISEILFGLIMVLTVTCTFSVSVADRRAVREMLFAALGCNLAWGVIDSVFYLMARFSERGRGVATVQALRNTSDPADVDAILTDALPPLLASVLTHAEFESLRSRLNQISDVPEHAWLSKGDWLAAVVVFLLVFGATLPVVVPFALVSDPKWALRISNGLAILMLFFAGRALGRYAGRRGWPIGLAMVMGGGVLVGITIVLGG